jgi:ribosomal protein L9
MMSMVVTWLMKSPLGAVAQPGASGDFVRVSDGRAAIYLLPDEFDDAHERRLRWLLAQQPTRPS